MGGWFGWLRPSNWLRTFDGGRVGGLETGETADGGPGAGSGGHGSPHAWFGHDRDVPLYFESSDYKPIV